MTWVGRDIVRLGSVASTNDEAMARARAGAAHGLVVVAETQQRGRGRGGHTWWSPPGDNLYVSVLFRLPLPPSAAPPITLAAGVAVCDAARDLGVAGNLKWPNDVLVRGKKLAGILTETATRGDRLEAIVVGIGLNVDTKEFPPELRDSATSLRIERGGEALGVDAALAALLPRLETEIDRFVAGGAAASARVWRERAGMLGKRLAIDVDGKTIEGIAHDLDDEGALLVHGDDGRRWRVLSGEITHVEAK